MGVLALQFKEGTTRKTLGLDGTERISIGGVASGLKPRATLTCVIRRVDGRTESVPLLCRIDTADELDYFRHGGILPYVLRGIADRFRARARHPVVIRACPEPPPRVPA
jgi:aconitate hydratase